MSCMEIKTLAVLILGGAFDASELGDNYIELNSDLIEALQQERVKGWDDVRVEMVERDHVERLTAERDALQDLLNKADESSDHYKQLWLAERQSNILKATTIKVAIQHLELCREKLTGVAQVGYIEALNGFIKEHKK